MTTEPLSGLRDYHLPESLSWWPPAIGWWLVLGLLSCATVGFLVLRRRRRLRRRPAHLATLELTRLRAVWQRRHDDRAYLSGLSQLLRRFALVRFPAENVAGLVGEAWLRFLAAHSDGDAFVRGVGRCLSDAPYRVRSEPKPDAAAVGDLVGRWIRRNAEIGAARRR